MTNQMLLWVGFGVFVLAMLAVDLGVFHRKAHVVGTKEALAWSAMWIGLALVFNLGLYLWSGPERGLAFLTGYLIEKSLSVDNIFVFMAIFSYFRVPALYQHKVLFWGIVGALIMRGILIAAGVTLIQKFHWVIYLFGAFLILTGVRVGLDKGREPRPERNPLLRLLRRFLSVTEGYEDGRFFVKRGRRYLATPLFVVLIVVETTDLVFAVDSIPAILAITLDPFIVWTSNVFAILGLRALYFALAGVMRRCCYLHYGLAAVLVFVGVKMLLADTYKVPVGAALGVVAGILTASVMVSVLWPRSAEVGAQASGPPGREAPPNQVCQGKKADG